MDQRKPQDVSKRCSRQCESTLSGNVKNPKKSNKNMKKKEKKKRQREEELEKKRR